MSMEHTISGRAALEQNLLDAGCCEEKTRQILQLWEEGRMTELLQLLRCQRCHRPRARLHHRLIQESAPLGAVKQRELKEGCGTDECSCR